LDQIKVLYRFGEIPMEGAIADLMWSDPEPDKDGFYLSSRCSPLAFLVHVRMSVSWCAGVRSPRSFLETLTLCVPTSTQKRRIHIWS
jgi:diadenosine tetraphosphatase ApaH/serine/threonine PP2A family protein phosphatase